MSSRGVFDLYFIKGQMYIVHIDIQQGFCKVMATSIRRSGFEFNVTAQAQPYHHLMEKGLVSTCQQQSTANIFFNLFDHIFFVNINLQKVLPCTNIVLT